MCGSIGASIGSRTLMPRNRLIAPERKTLASDIFDQPIFAGYAAHRDLFDSAKWPSFDLLNSRLSSRTRMRFVPQDDDLLRDGLHYETRIHDQHRIATRPENWHDLFNALVWIEYPAIKQALNVRQVADIALHGARHRSRAQYALTHFDETGVAVWVEDDRLLSAWDRHDWRTWFNQHDAFEQGRIRVYIFGHALLEQAICQQRLSTGKCLVLSGGQPDGWATCLANAIASGEHLKDPQELRPLPLAGLPGWSQAQQDPAFYDHDRFRPLREGRRYPPPIACTDLSTSALR